MPKKEKPEYATIVGLLNETKDEKAELLLSTSSLFKQAVLHVFELAKEEDELPPSQIGWIYKFRKEAMNIIPNRRYADASIKAVYGMYESAKALGLSFKEDVEVKQDWFMFGNLELEYPPSGIILKSPDLAKITLFDWGKKRHYETFGFSTSRRYNNFIEHIINNKVKYGGKVIIKTANERGGHLFADAELQVTVPADIYKSFFKKYDTCNGKLIGGIDINTDRINLAIIDRKGRLKDTKTFWFEEITARGFPRKKAWSIINEAIHKMLKYAYHNGVCCLAIENPEVLGWLKFMWIKNPEKRFRKNWNWKVATFRSRIGKKIEEKAPLYAINITKVNPKGTTSSEEHDKVMRRLGLDRHQASAYLIGLRGVEKCLKR